MFGGRGRQVPGAGHLRGEHLGEVGRLFVAQQAVAQHSGAVHDAVEPAVALPYSGHHGPYGLLVGDVRAVVADGGGRRGECGQAGAHLALGEDPRGRGLDLRGRTEPGRDQGGAEGDPVLGLGEPVPGGGGGSGFWGAAEEFDVASRGMGQGQGGAGGDAAGSAGEQDHGVGAQGRRGASGRCAPGCGEGAGTGVRVARVPSVV